MFVCLCHGVSETKIKTLLRSGVKSLQDLQAKCKAGANCGMCLFQVREIVEESRRECNADTDDWQKAGGD